MSSSLNSRIARRRALRTLLGLGGLAVLGGVLPPSARANVASIPAGFRPWGRGEFRRFGFLVYEAALWSGGEDPARPPLALQLTYKRTIAGKDIANASVKEIRNLGIASPAQLEQWGVRMAQIFPDVRPGDSIVGVYRDGKAQFLYNGRLIGEIDDAAFARAFFAIWLDANTSAPELRSALLKRAAN